MSSASSSHLLQNAWQLTLGLLPFSFLDQFKVVDSFHDEGPSTLQIADPLPATRREISVGGSAVFHQHQQVPANSPSDVTSLMASFPSGESASTPVASRWRPVC